MRRNRIFKEAEGYMTLEATMLFPVIMMSLLFLLYMGFYRYDACLTRQDACLIAVAGEIPYRAELAVNYTQKALKERYPEKYLSYQAGTAKQQTEKDKVQVELAGKVVVPVGVSFFPEGKGRLTTKTILEVPRQNPLEFIRNIRKVKVLAEFLGGDASGEKGGKSKE